MTRAIILRHPHHGFDACADVIAARLGGQHDLALTVAGSPGMLTDGSLESSDVVIIGSGLTHRVGEPGARGTYYAPAFTDAQSRSLLEFVAGGGGFIGLHITGWFVGGELVSMLGGSASVHPPAEHTRRFTVRIAEPEHEIVSGNADFDLRDDELYIPGWGPQVTVLATASWSERQIALMWAKSYHQGRVFYSSVGHAPVTYENPSIQRILAAAIRWCGRGAPP
jgi:type 1 glutamine amidotransferase